MSRTCDICSRGALRGNSRSHSNIATKRWQSLNLQNKIVDGVRKKVCTKCLKTIAKNKTKAAKQKIK